ncbi:hypothetical protein, partial [Salmonella enterica]|uniref:hypothetical protein n=1 Tax=Salmonella enterica TaxID=28901 RepID=UPI000709A076
TLTNLSGKDVAGLLAYQKKKKTSALPVGVPVPWPSILRDSQMAGSVCLLMQSEGLFMMQEHDLRECRITQLI